jgi:hypothetical protein
MFQNFKRTPWIRPPPQISTQIYATEHTDDDIRFKGHFYDSGTSAIAIQYAATAALISKDRSKLFK